MKLKRVLIGGVLVLVGLPVVLILMLMVSVAVLDRTNGTLSSSGEEREYLLHVPPSYAPATPTPLIISLHGAAVWPAQQMNLSGWNRLADEHGFIVAYPAGAETPRIWHVDRGDGLRADVRFIADLIDALRVSHNIDPARIYVNGMSNGGGMAFVLSCTLSDRIAAVGMVAAAQSLPWSWCTDQRAVPMIAFHGTADPIVPYDGGLSPVPGPPVVFPAIPSWIANWAARNRCEATPVESVAAADVTRVAYANCAGGAAVVHYRVRDGGHTWPGGKPLPAWMVGRTSTGVDATKRMWEFFREHRLTAR